MNTKVHDEYKRLATTPETSLAPCPCCGATPELWQYSKTADSPSTKTVMCSNHDPIGPQCSSGGFVTEGCVLYMPPDDFYRPTIREAIQYWNEYAAALTAQRNDRLRHEGAAGDRAKPAAFDFLQHLVRQSAFSARTFGPGMRTQGVVDHIRKELIEVLANPADLSEWIDVTILALDGAWRTGATPEQIIAALVAKQTKNEGRQWPDWRTAEPGKAIEHVRTADESLDTSEREAVDLYPAFAIKAIEAADLDTSSAAMETDAARDVLAERTRQKEGEGWTADHDDSHTTCAMAAAAACYALFASSSDAENTYWNYARLVASRELWPWDQEWWKPSTQRRDLVKAGALILAEIERLDRETARNGGKA